MAMKEQAAPVPAPPAETFTDEDVSDTIDVTVRPWPAAAAAEDSRVRALREALIGVANRRDPACWCSETHRMMAPEGEHAPYCRDATAALG